MKIRYPTLIIFITLLLSVFVPYSTKQFAVQTIIVVFCLVWLIYAIIRNTFFAITNRKGYRDPKQNLQQDVEMKRLRDENKLLKEANEQLVKTVQSMKKEQEYQPWEK